MRDKHPFRHWLRKANTCTPASSKETAKSNEESQEDEYNANRKDTNVGSDGQGSKFLGAHMHNACKIFAMHVVVMLLLHSVHVRFLGANNKDSAKC